MAVKLTKKVTHEVTVCEMTKAEMIELMSNEIAEVMAGLAESGDGSDASDEVDAIIGAFLLKYSAGVVARIFEPDNNENN